MAGSATGGDFDDDQGLKSFFGGSDPSESVKGIFVPGILAMGRLAVLLAVLFGALSAVVFEPLTTFSKRSTVFDLSVDGNDG